LNDIDLSIVIPAYNEETRLPRYLKQIIDYFAVRGTRYEVIVVDDGSVDATASVVHKISAKNHRIKLITLPANRGKGHAVKTGMLAATGKLALFADADGATPIGEVERLKHAIEGGADVAIASRAMREQGCQVRAQLHRKIMGSVFNFVVTTVAVKGINDTQCGFKLFKREAAQAVFPLQRIDDFGFDVEILFLCRKNRCKISEVPVNWTEVKGSKVGLVRDSLRMLVDVFRVRANDLRGLYRPAPAYAVSNADSTLH
jgi:dolichyl-phosphate beta-glucosyltransferase